jgi:hypothetical protein
LVGGLLLLVGYWGVSGSPFVAEQLSYIASGGLAGVSLVAIGVGLLISADLHDEWRKLDRIEAAILGESRTEVVVSDDAQPAAPGEPGPNGPPSSRSGGPVTSGAMPTSNGVTGMSRPIVSAAPVQLASHAIATLLLGLGGAVVVLGWLRTSGTSDVDRAVSGLGIGGLGLCLALVAVGGFGVPLRRRVMARRSRLLDTWLLSSLLSEKRSQWCRRNDDRAVGQPFVFVVDGQSRYHLEDCPFLAERSSRRIPRSQIDGGLTACLHCGA